MSAPMTIPSLSQEDIQVILDTINMNFNVMIMEALLFGLYTGVFGTTMWTIFSSVRSGHGTKIMTTIISCLFFLEIVTFALDWSLIYSAFVQNGWNFFTVFSELEDTSPKLFKISLVTSISSGISTLLVDVSMIWRCWTVWEQQWLVIIFPFLCCLAGTAAKVVQTYYYIYSNANDIAATLSYGKVLVTWTISYISLTLATTLICTILIICRIIFVGRANHGGIRSYRGVIEILVESALLYSIALLILTGLMASDNIGSSYGDMIAATARVIAPTLIAGRVAAGHAQVNDLNDCSVTSSLHFGAFSHSQSQSSIDEEATNQPTSV